MFRYFSQSPPLTTWVHAHRLKRQEPSCGQQSRRQAYQPIVRQVVKDLAMGQNPNPNRTPSEHPIQSNRGSALLSSKTDPRLCCRSNENQPWSATRPEGPSKALSQGCNFQSWFSYPTDLPFQLEAGRKGLLILFQLAGFLDHSFRFLGRP